MQLLLQSAAYDNLRDWDAAIVILTVCQRHVIAVRMLRFCVARAATGATERRAAKQLSGYISRIGENVILRAVLICENLAMTNLPQKSSALKAVGSATLESLMAPAFFAGEFFVYLRNLGRTELEVRNPDLLFIPYKHYPLSNLRAFLGRLPRIVSWILLTLIISFMLVISFLAIAAVGTGQGGPLGVVAMMLLMFNCALALPTYFLLAMSDFLVCDELGIKMARHEIRTSKMLQWNELQEVSIVDNARRGWRHNFALRLNGKKGRKLLIEISRLPAESANLLAQEIEKRAPFCRNLSQFAEVERFRQYQNGDLPNLSYDQLWESLSSKIFELTAFTPLPPNFRCRNNTLTIIRQFSSGGFSAVYLAEDNDGAKVVLKESVLPFGVDDQLKKKASEQFAREATLLTQLRHPQIARVLDHFMENGRHYLLLEYLPGKTLRQLIHEEGPTGEGLCISWSLQMCEILSYLHEQEIPIVHRDLAPDNMIVSETGKIFLIDFGSANEFVGAATGTLVGKHGYMSPEQIRGKATPVSDLYSLGQTLYYCLTGCDPLPLKPASFQADPSPFKSLITRTTSLDVPTRPPSARILSEEITKLVSDKVASV